MMSSGLSVVVVTLTGLLADPVGMYLPSAETGGSEYQFNPASPELRQAVKRRWPKPDELLDARALADDLVFLRRALRKQYVGYPELLQLPDWDVEAAFDQQIARLRAGPAKVKFSESALALFKEIKRHINDRHLGMIGWDPEPQDEYTEYQAPITGPAPALEGCLAPQASPTTVRVAGWLGADGKRGQVLTVSAHPQGETLELTCGARKFPLKARPPSRREDGLYENPAYEWRRARGATIIRIRQFMGSPQNLAELEQLVKDYPQHRRAPVIVFDLRGNGGGNDGYVHQWVAQARRGEWDSGGGAVYPVGSFIPWHRWNLEVWDQIERNRVDNPVAVAAREEIRKQWPRSAAQLSVEFRSGRKRSEGKLPYQGRVFVLVDRPCGSSGESAADTLRASLGATLVGERTKGLMEYGNVRALVMPRTHLSLHFAVKRNYFPTPREAVGTPVDVYLAPELMDKPVEQLLPLLVKLPR